MIGSQGVVEDHCDDDDKSIQVNQRRADMKGYRHERHAS